MARPIKPIKRTKKHTVRFTFSEDVILKRTASKYGITVSEYIRQKAMNIKIKPVMTDDEVKVFLSLTGMANNLNQLTKQSHLKIDVSQEVHRVLSNITSVLNSLK
jgi:hypothetical protein